MRQGRMNLVCEAREFSPKLKLGAVRAGVAQRADRCRVTVVRDRLSWSSATFGELSDIDRNAVDKEGGYAARRDTGRRRACLRSELLAICVATT